MAQLKSTSVTGNLSATGNIIASQIIKNGGTEDQLLKANGETQSLKAITDDISDNTTAITTLKGEKSGGGLPETSNDSTITVANALKRANDAYDLADTKTTMSAVESKGYATKNEAQGYANAVLGDDKDTNADKTVYGAFAAAAAAHAAADSANTNANNRVPTSGDTTIAGKLTADQFIGPLQGYARYLETKKQDKAGGGWYGSEYNFYTQWDEDTNSICELKTVGNYDTRATRAFEDADGNVISSTYLKLNGNQLSNSTSTYDKVLVANNNKLGYRTKAELRTDLDLATAYFYKGTLADINALKNITSANIGDVYFISETKDSWACKQVVDEPYGSGDNYENYWSNLGQNIDLSSYMTLDTNQTITGQKTFNNIYATTFNGNLSGTAANTNQLNILRGIGSGTTSHADALKNEFDTNKGSIPRNVLNTYYSSTSNNGSFYMGYFLNGYNDTPYGGFYVSHYNNPYYVGIAGGVYTQQNILTDTNFINSFENNTLPKFNSSKQLIKSNISDNGSDISITGLLNVTKNNNTVSIGSKNASFCHIYNSSSIPFIFNNTVASVSGDLGTTEYPWQNIKLNEALQFFSSTTKKAEMKYNSDDKCIDVLFT